MTGSPSLPPPPPPPGVPPPPPASKTDHDRPPHLPFPPGCRWGLGDAFASYGIFLLSSLVMTLVAIASQGGVDELSGAWLPLVVVVPPLIQLIHLLWVSHARGTGLSQDFGFSFRWSDLTLGAGLFFVAMFLAAIAVVALEAVGIGAPNAAVAELAEDSEDGGGITVWLILLAVFAGTVVPIIEELVYRGLWWSALLKKGVGENWVLVITSAVFAMAHLEPVRTIILFSLAMAIGLGRRVTGRIGAGIVAHAAINTIGMIALLATMS